MGLDTGALVIYGAEIELEHFDPAAAATVWRRDGYGSLSSWMTDVCRLPDPQGGDEEVTVQSDGHDYRPRFVAILQSLPSAHLDGRGATIGVQRVDPLAEEDRIAAEQRIRKALADIAYTGEIVFGWHLICYASW